MTFSRVGRLRLADKFPLVALSHLRGSRTTKPRAPRSGLFLGQRCANSQTVRKPTKRPSLACKVSCCVCCFAGEVPPMEET